MRRFNVFFIQTLSKKKSSSFFLCLHSTKLTRMPDIISPKKEKRKWRWEKIDHDNNEKMKKKKENY